MIPVPGKLGRRVPSASLYRVFIKNCVFPLNFVIFLNSASSAEALVFYLPGVCTHTDTEGKQRKTRVRNLLNVNKIKQIGNKQKLQSMSSYDFICRASEIQGVH